MLRIKDLPFDVRGGWGSDIFFPSPSPYPPDPVGFHETVRVITCLALTQIWCQGVIKLKSQDTPGVGFRGVSLICQEACKMAENCLFLDSI